MGTNAIQMPGQDRGTTVIIVNQDSRHARTYLDRGTTCCNGCHVGMCSFVCILFLAIIILIISFVSIQSSLLSLIGIFFGVFLIFLYVRLSRRAKRDFDALPPDHPDRLKYSGVDITRLPVNLNPPRNEVASPSTVQIEVPVSLEEQNYEFPRSSFPPSPNHPGQGPSAPPQETYPPSQGFAPAQVPSVPYTPPPPYSPPQAKGDDDPPPYSSL